MNNIIAYAVKQQDIDLSRLNTAKRLIKAGFLIMSELYETFDFDSKEIPIYDAILDFIENEIHPSEFYQNCVDYGVIIAEEDLALA